MRKDADVCFHVPTKAKHTQSTKSEFQHFSKLDVRVLDEILCAVQHQRIGDTVLFGVLHHIAFEEAEVEDMNFRIVLHGELRKGVAVGVFNKQELAALAAALCPRRGDHRLV